MSEAHTRRSIMMFLLDAHGELAPVLYHASHNEGMAKAMCQSNDNQTVNNFPDSDSIPPPPPLSCCHSCLSHHNCFPKEFCDPLMAASHVRISLDTSPMRACGQAASYELLACGPSCLQNHLQHHCRLKARWLADHEKSPVTMD